MISNPVDPSAGAPFELVQMARAEIARLDKCLESLRKWRSDEMATLKHIDEQHNEAQRQRDQLWQWIQYAAPEVRVSANPDPYEVPL